MHDSDPSMNRAITIVRQFDKVFETYCVLFKELEVENQQSSQCFCKQKKTLRDTKIILGGDQLLTDFLLVATVWEPNLT